jgi:hypothetical protein
MDMKKILENMDSAAAGDKPSVAGSNVNDMKTILESIQAVDECGPMVDEGPMPTIPAPEMDKGNPVTVSVSMNASGKEHVADLLDMMKNAGLGDAAPAADAMMSPRQDMERLSAMMAEPGDEDPNEEMDMDEGAMKDQMMDDAENMDKEDFCEKYMAQGMDKAECEEHWNSMNEESVEEADYANEPDEKYDDHEVMIKDLSGGINREKKSYKAAQRGDNAMATESIKSKLWAALAEKKKPDADGDGVPDWADKKPGKDDNEGKKKGSKPKKGEVPPQFKKK